MSPTGILRSIFSEDVIRKWRGHPSPTRDLSHKIDVLTASGPEPSDELMAYKLRRWRAQKAAWDAYVTAAAICGLFDGDDGRDLVSRLTGTDDDNFRSALAECKACWFFAGKLRYRVTPRPVGRNSKKLDLLVQVGELQINVEVKSPHRERDKDVYWDDEFTKISDCVSQANKQFPEGSENILFIAPELRFELFSSRYNLLKALYGKDGIGITFNNETGEPIGEPVPIFNPDGKFFNRKRPGGKLLKPDGSPAYRRVGAVFSFEEAYGGTKLITDLDCDKKIWVYHKVLIAHNPYANNPIPKDKWPGHIQFVPEGDIMRWTDNYKGF